jgi:hypothetical protein
MAHQLRLKPIEDVMMVSNNEAAEALYSGKVSN